MDGWVVSGNAVARAAPSCDEHGSRVWPPGGVCLNRTSAAEIRPHAYIPACFPYLSLSTMPARHHAIPVREAEADRACHAGCDRRASAFVARLAGNLDRERGPDAHASPHLAVSDRGRSVHDRRPSPEPLGADPGHCHRVLLRDVGSRAGAPIRDRGSRGAGHSAPSFAGAWHWHDVEHASRGRPGGVEFSGLVDRTSRDRARSGVGPGPAAVGLSVLAAPHGGPGGGVRGSGHDDAHAPWNTLGLYGPRAGGLQSAFGGRTDCRTGFHCR